MPSRSPVMTGAPSLLPVVTRHDSPHKLIEERHSKRRVAVTRAPNHAFCNQLASRRAERGDLPIELIRNVAGAMWSRAELCHGAQVPFLERSQTVKSNTKETFIQRRYCGPRSYLDIT